MDEDTKRKMELQQQPDGEFWMRYNDFCQHFNEVTICTTGPDYDGDGVADAAGTNCALLFNLYMYSSTFLQVEMVNLFY